MNDLRGGLPLWWWTPLDIQQGVLKQGRELLSWERRLMLRLGQAPLNMALWKRS